MVGPPRYEERGFPIRDVAVRFATYIRETMRRRRDLAVALAGLTVVVSVCAVQVQAHPEHATGPVPTPEVRSHSPERASAVREFRAERYPEAAAALEAWLVVDPDDHDAAVLLGWSRFRQGKFEAAGEAFRSALRITPTSPDAQAGLAYVALNTRPAPEAAAAFDAVLAKEPGHGDALRGRALAVTRPGADASVARGAAEAARRLLANDASDDDAAWLLVTAERLLGKPGEMRRTPASPRLGGPEYSARAGIDYLEVRSTDGDWSPVFIKGINLGAALPGHFPTEFPRDEETWREWIDQIAALGANAVRTYTLLPPAFYRMLAERNAFSSAGNRLWLLQGIWTELPEGHDFSNPDYESGLRAEIARVVDAVHGDLVLGARPGHASGVYDADVSRYVLAWIVGREWEPFAVAEYDAMRPGRCDWQGVHVGVEGGRAMECWVGRTLDFTAGYEGDRYGAARPLTFANWPTLDPLDHPTEANRLEEESLRRKLGLPSVESFREAVWDNDAVSLDATKIRATGEFPPGVFASYHIYPNYPDFLNNDPRYASARDADGVSRYAGYLRELKAYHGAQPVLVAEFGMSTSRGVAHVQPEGWHHGGHDESEAMRIDARLLRSIRDERMAGGVLFSFQDEWFKGTWSVSPVEVPADRRRLWFNAESPEQSYGVLARRPAAPILVDGLPWDWPMSAPPAEGTVGKGWQALRSVSAASDEGYLYLLLRTDGGEQPPDWRRVAYRIAIDTYDPERGVRTLPSAGSAPPLPTGIEFLCELGGPGASEILVAAPYDSALLRDGGPVASPAAPEGRMVPLEFETNRERIARDGTRIPAIDWNRGALRFGSLDPSSPEFDTRTDVAVGASTGAIEMRIPWNLLNVTDPSSRRVLHQPAVAGDGVAGTVETDGFVVYAFAVDARDRSHVFSTLIPGDPSVRWIWEGWSEPRFRSEWKHGVEVLRAAFRALRPLPGGEESR